MVQGYKTQGRGSFLLSFLTGSGEDKGIVPQCKEEMLMFVHILVDLRVSNSFSFTSRRFKLSELKTFCGETERLCLSISEFGRFYYLRISTTYA